MSRGTRGDVHRPADASSTGLSPALAGRSRLVPVAHAAPAVSVCQDPTSPTTPPGHRTHPVPSRRFWLCPFRSPLLRASLLISLPLGTEMVQFPRCAFLAYGFHQECQPMTTGGFPHSDISGSQPVYGSPKLFAVHHVLHRRNAPRHPSYALRSLTPFSCVLCVQTPVFADGRLPDSCFVCLRNIKDQSSVLLHSCLHPWRRADSNR